MQTQKLLKLIVLGLIACMLICAQPLVAGPAAEKAISASASSQQVSPQEKDIFASLNAPETKEQEKSEDPSMVATVIGFIAKLILVLAIAYACIFALKKINTFKAGVVDSKKRVIVLEHTSIGPGRQLHLVSVGGKSLLIGSTPQQVSILTELDPDLIPDYQEEETASFKEQFSQFLGHNPKKAEAAKSVAEMLRESTNELRGTVTQIGKLRGNLRQSGDE